MCILYHILLHIVLQLFPVLNPWYYIQIWIYCVYTPGMCPVFFIWTLLLLSVYMRSHRLTQCHIVIHASVSANIFFYTVFIYLASMAAIISWHLQELDTHEGDVQVCSTHSLSSYPHLPLTLQPTPSPFRHFRDWLCFELRKRQPVWRSQLLSHLLQHAWLVTLLLFCFFYRSVKHGPLCSLVWLNYVQLCLLMW